MTIITEAAVDLNIVLKALEENGFTDETDYAEAGVVELSKTYRDGAEAVVTLDFNDYTVKKDYYNNKGVRLNDASSFTVVKHTRDLEVIANSIV